MNIKWFHWLIALLCAACLHMALFVQWSNNPKPFKVSAPHAPTQSVAIQLGSTKVKKALLKLDKKTVKKQQKKLKETLVTSIVKSKTTKKIKPKKLIKRKLVKKKVKKLVQKKIKKVAKKQPKKKEAKIVKTTQKTVESQSEPQAKKITTLISEPQIIQPQAPASSILKMASAPNLELIKNENQQQLEDEEARLRAEYTAKLSQWLVQHQRYPRRAKRKNQEGVVKISFTVLHSGQTTDFAMMVSSGIKALDTEAQNMLKRASPLPVMPPKLSISSLDITIPIAFILQ